MLFVTLLKSSAGSYTEAIRDFKKVKVPEGVKIREYLAVFGEYDCVVVFEAVSEEKAAEFILQLGDYATLTTLVAFPVEKLKWTR